MEVLFEDSETGSKICIDDGDICIYDNLDSNFSFMRFTLEEWLIITRLTNALWYSNLISQIPSLCYNPSCHNRPSGAHRIQEGCVPFGEYLRNQFEANVSSMRKLRVSQNRPIPPSANVGD